MRWFFLLLLMGVAFAQSQNAPAAKEAPKAATSPAQEQRGTKDNPLTVNVVPTAEQKANTETKDAEAKIKAADDKKLIEYTRDQVLIGIVTFFIFLLQLIAFITQACYMRRSFNEMRRTTKATIRTARAAQKSADVAEAALTVAERPYLVPNEPKMKVWRYGPSGMPPSTPPEYVGTIEYGVFNMGRTIAFLKEVTVRLIFVETLPDNPDYRAGVESPNDSDLRVMIGHYPIRAGKPYKCSIYKIGLKQKINAATFNRIQSGELIGFFFGYVRYTDVFEYLYTEGFCFRYIKIGIDQTVSQCAIVAGKNYNYSRREKIPLEGIETLSPQGAELTDKDIEKLNAEMRGERMGR